MYSSLSFLSKVCDNRKKKAENFTDGIGGSISNGASDAFDTAMLVFGIIFFAMEIILIYYALVMAFKCTEGGGERIVHVTLAVFFTFPYVLLMALFNKCGGDTLRVGSSWVESQK